MKRPIMMGLCLAVCAQAIMTAGLQTNVLAYESKTVTQGAVLRGTVTFTGTVPAPKEFEMRRYPDQVFCGALSDGAGHRLLKEVNVGGSGGLKDVVVVVEGVQSGKPFTFTDAQVEANVCQFLPFVTVVSDKRELTVTNRDPVSHDIQGYAYDQAGVDIVLHRPSLKATGTTDVVNLVKGRKVFTMQCGMHPYMQNWGYAIDNPYYAVTDPEGVFTIGDLPPGTYHIKAWHPMLGVQEQDVTVPPSGAATLNLQFDSKRSAE
ncbi:MAG: carboxypeptidase regulatory-like domain-containing protein [Nitrospira sp.]|nr:carboxypeptidase regulatory-like domain-containing protein [Nitrospira sp.]MBH0186993.1 carboxypeptidase regulatory-like domain-containing protein [Nitrospira sp.]